MPNTALATTQREVTLYEVRPLSQNPAAVYLAGLSEGSRRTMREALNTVADMSATASTTPSACRGRSCAFSIPRRSGRSSRPATPSRRRTRRFRPCAGTLKAAWRLGQMSAEDYARAVDVQNVSRRTPAGGPVNRHG